VGAHAITARYGGAANFRASTSPALTEIIHKAATAATVAASPNPAVLGQAVTFTAMASVIAPGAGIPLGPVTFLDRATVPGTAMLSAGQATLRTNTLSVGAYAITAHYGGATNFGPSASNALIETIDKAGIKTTVSASRTRRQEPSSPTTAGGGPGRDVPRDGKRASAGSGDAADRSQ